MNILQEIKNIKAARGGWYNKRFDAWFHFLFSAGVGAAEIPGQRLPVFMRWGCWIIEGHTYDWFWNKADMCRVRNWLIRKNRHNLKHVNKLLAIWRRDEKIFRENLAWFESHDWAKLADGELAERYDRLYRSYAWCNSIPYLADSFLTSGEEDPVLKELRLFLEKKVPQEKLPEILSVLAAPVYDSFNNRSHKSLLRLALRFQRRPRLWRALKYKDTRLILRELERRPAIGRAVERHIEQYHWIHNNYYAVKRPSTITVLAEINKLATSCVNIAAELKKEESAQRNNRRAKAQIFKRYRLPKHLQNLVHLSELMTRWQDDRKSAVYQVNAIMFPVVREAVKRTGVPWRELVMTTREEFKIALKEKKYQRPIWRQRRKRAIAIHTKRGSVILSGRQSQSFRYADFFKHTTNQRVLTGLSACAGTARGKVRLVNDTKSLRLIRPGEILVANNTTPDYVPGMKRAAAVVTEQGGITGHAAIVSRELGVPCVVGVEQITKILHNGQAVEVDATNGRITIITKKT